MPRDKLSVSVGDEVLVRTDDTIHLSTPKKYNVVFFNDDYTPIEFVVTVLMDIFHHSEDIAKEIAQMVHDEGKAIAGTYNFEIAEQKSLEAISQARADKHPLQVKLEPVA
tara:strand:+ start:533 stop:862 length:330 start_codon:yes stop_codon:yes gene_type:complete